MRNKMLIVSFLCSGLILTGCGTSDEPGELVKGNKTMGNIQVNTSTKSSGWETIEVVSGRNIIAQLKQTAKETPSRDAIVEQIKKNREYQEGMFGEPTDELADALAIQQVEAQIAIPLLHEIYGGHEAFSKEGVIFLEKKARGAEQSGFWIGIKNPDDRLKKFVDEMQKKVDAGEAKAEYIYIFHTPFSQSDNNQLAEKVKEAVEKYKNNHELSNRVSFGISVDTITGNINITHNFLSEDQKKSLQNEFSGRKIVFEQDGERLAPGNGESDTIYPDKKFTNQLSKTGSYIMEIDEKGILVVDAKPQDFSENGGDPEFYSAIRFSFPDASEKLKVGQRVKVQPSGAILESYPGQATALYVEVLPEYKPEAADLSESEVIRKAIQKIKNNEQFGLLIIKNLTYDQETDKWTVSFKQGEDLEIEVKDS